MKTTRLPGLGLVILVCFTSLVLAAADPIAHQSPDGSPDSRQFFNSRQPAIKKSAVTYHEDANIRRVIVKLQEGTRARWQNNQIISLGGRNLDNVNTILAAKRGGAIRRLVFKDPDVIEQDRFQLELKIQQQLADFNNYFVIDVASANEAESLVNQLNTLPEVEIAYGEPQPEPAVDISPPTPDYTADQDYLDAAPGGVDAYYAWTVPGGDGTGIKIVDIEGGWTLDHEDLESAADGLLGGTMYTDPDWVNHGTAVIGEMVGTPNDYGVTGITPNAEIGMVAIGGIGTTEAILTAIDSLEAGDVILIELHAPGPAYNFQTRPDQLGYIMMEYWQANFDAIQLAWAKGITVCEAAGNGAENFDNDAIYENLFDTTYRNSHAIVCGAGAPPSGAHGIDRSKLSFSNWGERVNLQGYGAGVVTTGYGGLFNGGGDDRQYYTATFGGTSSASPIVTSSVAAIQGIYKARYNGQTMNADRIRDLLAATGSPQQYNTSLHIGPRPNLLAAEAALPAPLNMAVEPLYFDTSIQVGTAETVSITLFNNSMGLTLDFEISAADSLAKDADWVSIPSPLGTILPHGDQSIDIIFDATSLEDQTEIYKTVINIAYGVAGGSLDDTLLLPIFLRVPCYDTTFIARSSGAGEFVYSWVDYSQIGTEIPDFSWYNPIITNGSKLDDGTAGPYFIGFDFPFYGEFYDQIYIGANGLLSFTDENLNVTGYYSSSVSIPAPPFATMVSPFYNDLNIDEDYNGHGTVHFYKSPKADTFAVQWTNVGNFNSPSDTMITFQAIFSKDGNVCFQYKDVGITGMENTAVVGVAAYDCSAEPFVVRGDPSENIPSNESAVLLEYTGQIWEQSGDANGDLMVNVADAVYLVNYVFKSGPAPYRLPEGDANCDGSTNVGDVILIVNYVFKAGPPPCEYLL